MAYDEDLATRLRDLLTGSPGLSEKRMFGGLAFLFDGHLAVSANSQGEMLLRCDPADVEALTAHPGVARFVMRGREMNGWLGVDASAVESEEALEEWVGRGVAYARSLPPR